MTTALTGSLGWTGAHPFELGGPPLVSTWTRPCATQARPLIAHVYDNDGVTPLGTFSILNRPAIKATTANGGFDPITLECEISRKGAVVGEAVFGASILGGLAQGNVVRLTEDGGPWPGFIYGGVVQSFPDTRSATGTSHKIVLAPFAHELLTCPTQLLYTRPVDVTQMVRDAVALTQHCHCDPSSVPAASGIPAAVNGAVDFRGQKVSAVLDLARSIAGPTWSWHCDENGRVWFQPQGSAASYTLMGGQHYQERTTNGGDISTQINQVPVAGSPAGGTDPVSHTYNGSSQGTIGVRVLDTPIVLANVTDSSVITAIANTVGAVLDQQWTRVALQVLPTLGQRIHASQPGGAMLRYWEPVLNDLPESAGGSGMYTGPFIVQSVEYDGGYQAVEAGNIPVTSQADVDNLTKSLVSRGASIALNLAPVVTSISPANPLGNQIFQLSDANNQPRLQFGNLNALGVSPAGYLFRAINSLNVPIFDSEGLIQVMNELGEQHDLGTNQNITSVAPTTTLLNDGVGDTASISFTLARQARVLMLASVTAQANSQIGNIIVFRDGADQGTIGRATVIQFDPLLGGFTNSTVLYTDSLAKGDHTVTIEGSTATGGTLVILGWDMWLFLLGS